MQKLKFKHFCLAVCTMITLLIGSANAYAKKQKRSNMIRPELLKLIQKRKQARKKENQSYFDLDELSSRYASWGIATYNRSSINLKNAWKSFKKKSDVTVAVIDTGIDPSHPFLKKNIYVTAGNPGPNNFGMDFSKDADNKNTPFDTHGHGTHVAGIVKSVYPDAKILTLKYYNPNASGQDNLNSTIDALRYAVKMGVDIINYSGGGPEPSLEELKILKEAEKKQILVVAAAGNEESNIDIKSNAYYPASYGLSNIIAVTAHDKRTQVLNSSNFGRKSVDISAPGYRIKSSLPNGRAGYLTGTSQATAFVSGVAALIKAEFPSITTRQIKAIINKSAYKEINLMSKCISGGKLDAAEAMKISRKLMSGNHKIRVSAYERDPSSIHFRSPKIKSRITERNIATIRKEIKKKSGKVILRLKKRLIKVNRRPSN